MCVSESVSVRVAGAWCTKIHYIIRIRLPNFLGLLFGSPNGYIATFGRCH